MLARLQRLHQDVVEVAPARFAFDPVSPMTVADKEEDDIALVAEALSGVEDGAKFVNAAEIAGIAHHELVPEPPIPEQMVARAVDRSDCLAVRPVMDDRQSVARGTSVHERCRHTGAKGNIPSRLSQRDVSEPAQQPGENPLRIQHTEQDRHLGKQVAD